MKLQTIQVDVVDEHVMDLVVMKLVLFLVENLVVAGDRVVDIV